MSNQETPFKVTVTVDGYDASSFEEHVIDRAAQILLSERSEDGEGRWTTLMDRISGHIVREGKLKAEEHIEALVANTLQAETIALNEWGEQVGDPISLRDWIRDKATSFINEKVRRHDGQSNPSCHDKKVTRGEYILASTLKGQMDAAFKEAVADELEKIRGRVKEIAAEAIAKHVK